MHQFFSKTETLLSLRRGPLGNYLDRYAAWLSEQGFCRVNARLQLVQIADFSLWLHNRGLTIVGVQPATIDSLPSGRPRLEIPKEPVNGPKLCRVVEQKIHGAQHCRTATRHSCSCGIAPVMP